MVTHVHENIRSLVLGTTALVRLPLARPCPGSDSVYCVAVTCHYVTLTYMSLCHTDMSCYTLVH